MLELGEGRAARRAIEGGAGTGTRTLRNSSKNLDTLELKVFLNGPHDPSRNCILGIQRPGAGGHRGAGLGGNALAACISAGVESARAGRSKSPTRCPGEGAGPSRA